MVSFGAHFISRSLRVKCPIGVVVVLNALFLAHYFRPHLRLQDLTAGNRTLGLKGYKTAGIWVVTNTFHYQTVLAVAPNDVPARLAWRMEGLLKASAYTGLDIQVMHQPSRTEADIAPLMFKSKELKDGYVLS